MVKYPLLKPKIPTKSSPTVKQPFILCQTLYIQDSLHPITLSTTPTKHPITERHTSPEATKSTRSKTDNPLKTSTRNLPTAPRIMHSNASTNRQRSSPTSRRLNPFPRQQERLTSQPAGQAEFCLEVIPAGVYLIGSVKQGPIGQSVSIHGMVWGSTVLYTLLERVRRGGYSLQRLSSRGWRFGGGWRQAVSVLG